MSELFLSKISFLLSSTLPLLKAFGIVTFKSFTGLVFERHKSVVCSKLTRNSVTIFDRPLTMLRFSYLYKSSCTCHRKGSCWHFLHSRCIQSYDTRRKQLQSKRLISMPNIQADQVQVASYIFCLKSIIKR